MDESKPPESDAFFAFELRHSFVIRHSSFVISPPKGESIRHNPGKSGIKASSLTDFLNKTTKSLSIHCKIT